MRFADDAGCAVWKYDEVGKGVGLGDYRGKVRKYGIAGREGNCGWMGCCDESAAAVCL